MAMGTNLPTSELERMASELKCPICLSLYKQAALLSCNHCFCTTCIVQSMKRISCCPICKVPAAPREVRSAPQMDTLVAIFKGMEASAGVSLFHTQQPSQLQSLGAEKHPAKQNEIGRKAPKSRGRKQKAQPSNHAPHSDTTMNIVSHSPKKRRKSQLVLPDNKDQGTEEYGMASGMIQNGSEDPSIQGAAVPVPARKKVRAAQSPLDAYTNDNAEQSMMRQSRCSESQAPSSSVQRANPVVPENGETNNPSITGNQGDESILPLDLNHEGPAFQPEEERQDLANTYFPNFVNSSGVQPPQLSPFFWLRDRVLPSQDDEPLTQITQTQGTARPLRPSFSDLKDSDDDDDDDQSEGVHRPDEVAGAELPDSYDSDTFVWSQRPCSPELCSSPEEKFDDERFHFKPKSFKRGEKSVLGRDHNSRPGGENEEPKSPHNVVVEAPLGVEATQTPELHQEPSRLIKGTLSKCSSSGKVCRRLRSHDNSFLSHKEDNTLLGKFVGPKRPTRRTRAQKKGRNPSDSSCQEDIPLEINLDGSSNELPSVDITADETPEGTWARQDKRSNKDAMPGHEQNDNSGGDTGAPDVVLSHESVKDGGPSCVFCGATGDSEVAGPLVEYKDAFPSRGQTRIKAVLVHKLCAEWAPDVYFNDDEPRNLACEVTRGQKIKCSSCGMRGAALGCCNKRCRKSFHYPCGRAIQGCKWDEDDFVMFCPQHADCKFPRRKRCRISPFKGPDLSSVEKDGLDKTAAQGVITQERWQKWPTGPACKWVLCGSALDPGIKGKLAAFASVTGASVAKRWSLNVTHVITGTDEQGGAKRTLKFLLALLQGRWIVKSEWMSACLSAGHIIGEDQYEVTSDINGCIGGPQRSRARAAARGPKLLEGLSFYFFGEFTSVSKEDLQSLIVAGRGVVLHRKPVSLEMSSNSSRGHTIVLYNGDNDLTNTAATVAEEAKSLAVNVGASAVPHNWLLDSVAACELQPPL
ncbi:unnamed protein product [Calypogeia fissa]